MNLTSLRLTITTLLCSTLNKRPLASVITLLVVIGVGAESSALAFDVLPATDSSLRTVALTGVPTSGTPDGVSFLRFEVPTLNNAGQTAFYGEVTGTGVTDENSEGIWTEGEAGLRLVARGDTPAAGTEALFDFQFSSRTPQLTDAGQVTFEARLTGTDVSSSNDRGVWSSAAGAGPELMVREGDAAPGISAGAYFTGIGRPLISDNGLPAFYGEVAGPGILDSNDDGIWRGTEDDELTLVARTGVQAPSADDGQHFFRLTAGLVHSGAGHIAFQTTLLGPAERQYRQAIYTDEAETGLRLVALARRQAPGTASDVSFLEFEYPVVNNLGQTAFIASLIGEGITNSNKVGIWSEAGGMGLQLIARTGSPAPGTDDGVTFRDFSIEPMINSKGNIAFTGSLIGTGISTHNRYGVWSDVGGDGLQLVAQMGSPAPDGPDGTYFSSMFNDLVLNSQGRFAFSSTISGPGIQNDNNRGLWAQDATGALRLIVREGDTIDADDGPNVDLRTISRLYFYGSCSNEDGRPCGFNNRGQVAFWATFTDGTQGVFVSNLVAVPEPSSLLLAAGGIALLVLRRKTTRR